MSYPVRLTAAEASQFVSRNPGAVLLDVRLADDYEAAHIEGALNNCVYEVAFLERLAAQVPDKSKPVLLCGSGEPSRETEMAAEKLVRAGYTAVNDLADGMPVCEKIGFVIVRGTPLAAPPEVRDGRHALNLEECRVEWLGRNLLNKHAGRVEIASGFLEFSRGQLSRGEIILDMRRMSCQDLAGTPMHDVLIAHLASDDFFDVERHPQAKIQIMNASSIQGACAGCPNVRVNGALTLRGVTREIEFTAAGGQTAEGFPAAQASFSIDRTRWGVLYGSGRFFSRLAGHLVNDMIEIQVRIVCAD